jgi:glutaredoxin 3
MPLLPSLIDSNRVVILAMHQCPFCVRAKQFFATLTTNVTAYDMDQMPDGPAIEAELQNHFSYDSVPALFVNGQFIGGFGDCDYLHAEGKLVPMLNVR